VAIDAWEMLQIGGEAPFPAVHAGTNQHGQFVQGLPLDDELAHVSRIDMVKIDMEGFELRTLRGFA
jgi:hypothetical protein